jgi:hypothetical protein
MDALLIRLTSLVLIVLMGILGFFINASLAVILVKLAMVKAFFNV